MSGLPHRLERTITIGATRETVFGFFTDNGRWASWWGTGSSIDPQPGGRLYIRYPNGVEASGEVIEIAPPDRLVFTFGFASGSPVPPGASRVTIRLDAIEDGTTLRLVHEFAESAARDQHVQGWRYQLAVFANVVADAAFGNAPTVVDRWFTAWSDRNEETRARTLGEIATPHVRLRDRFSLVDGLTDLLPHIAAAQRFMPGLTMARDGAVRQCQGMVLADWQVTAADGTPRGRGTNVFTLAADGRIASVTGFWNV
jgi:uncharacterized protein YndB with AHSA1/START domain